MNKILPISLFIVLSASLIVFGQSKPSLWHLTQIGEARIGLFQNRGYFTEFFVTADSIGGKFGPIAVWQAEHGGDFIQVSHSLSGIDEAFREEGRVGGTRAIGVLMEYLRYYGGMERSFILTPETKASFFTQLRQSPMMSIENKIGPLIEDWKADIGEKEWKISFTVVTWRGAIERKSYSGSKTPISISRETVDIVAPAGTVPEFGFDPMLSAEDARRRSK